MAKKSKTSESLFPILIFSSKRFDRCILRSCSLLKTRSNNFSEYDICKRGNVLLECPRGVMVKAMDYGIVVSEFVLQSPYCIHFRVNTLGKGTPYPPSYGLSSTTPVLPEIKKGGFGIK